MPKRPSCFITTVGTSLIGGDNHILSGYKPNNEYKIDDIDYLNAIEGTSYTCTADSKIITLLKNNASMIKLNKVEVRHGAEICALFRSDTKPFTNDLDVVILFGTRTKMGAYCAAALKRILCELAPSSQPNAVELIFPKYLGLPDDPNFSQKGLNSLLDECYNIFYRYEKTHDIFLIPNGGYKALIPDLTMMGIIKKRPVRYVYEETQTPMDLPLLPLGPDMELFGTHEIAIEGLLGQPAINRQLPDEIKRLLTVGTKGVEFIPLGKFLWDAYRNQCGITSLGRAADQKGLLEYLDDDLRQKFLSLARLDHLIWKGDRVPEMVEHAVRHHTNLFRLAQRILIPCFECIGPSFLSKEELFTLLCALLLHDCGHVVGSVEWPHWTASPGKERLFSGEIREFHNILGYLRLKNGFSVKDPFHQSIKSDQAWVGITDIWCEYLEAPATAGLYHRQATPLNSFDQDYCECNFRTILPLERIPPVYIGTKKIPNEKMMFIVALLRLIDGLDNQSSRAGGSSYVKFHLHVLESEIADLETRIIEFESQHLLTVSLQNEIKSHCVRSEVIKNTINDRKALRSWISANPRNCYMIRHYMEIILLKRFKELQKKHYAKHLPVKKIIIEDDICNNNRINLHFSIEIDNDLIQTGFDANVVFQTVLDEMKEECKKIKDILSNNGVEISYD